MLKPYVLSLKSHHFLDQRVLDRSVHVVGLRLSKSFTAHCLYLADCTVCLMDCNVSYPYTAFTIAAAFHTEQPGENTTKFQCHKGTHTWPKGLKHYYQAPKDLVWWNLGMYPL